ncbi:major outer membrane protein [Campylobacter upsaliensis]|uniref:major outer membrane protein n=1 Tax=Campylobacter upsaliensis TaxID=28080 RepID=UPI00214A18DE|nr:major outer membrane protein [Campylobacter upsaliensis]MCR2097169.1 major outer membrane protein [Campylobacter upsaliensis]
MKLVKLSLVAALAAGAFSVANATPLEEAIKDIDVSGVLRYRYRAGNIDGVDNKGLVDQNGKPQDGLITDKQMHQYRAQINFNAAIADNFKAFVQLDYSAKDGGYGVDTMTNPINEDKGALHVRQLYLTYTNEDFATSVIAGKQQLNTIWTDNGIDGLVGTGIKVLNNSFDGLTLAAFAVDSFAATEQTGDLTGTGNIKTFDEVGNLYGGAAIASYEVFGGQFDSQLWGAYWDSVGAWYALDLAYGTTIFNDINWKLNAAYLGNYLDKTYTFAKPAKKFEDGNFFALRGSIDWNGFDASLGGLYYGEKDAVTVTVIEDQGNIGHLLAGQEIFYTEGSHLNGDYGQNTFGYLTAGYTFNEVLRLGADFVYGGTKTDDHMSGGEKMEAVARVDYKYSPKLSFQAWYSYLNIDRDAHGEGQKDTVRLQALYKF